MELTTPSGVSASFERHRLSVKGPKGTVERDFSKIPVSVEVKDAKILLSTTRSRKGDKAILNTCRSHVGNMFKGVTEGFTYRLKVVFAHFPITVKVQGSEVHVENFYGERAPRRATIVSESTKVQVEGDDLVVSGPDLEAVGQTAANIELSTKVKEKDQRIFLDGVYIYERKK
ncbi:MAG: 50S ribosomal protein L6 [Nitrososphaerota archaeon]|nr:50S ribosomal protein L6 [Nitrososphaerota archaeon]MDG6939511.1 50S ribosomal protein L6 [Nitrososphaerota archaeon]